MNSEPQIPSPCIKVCVLDEELGLCRGCLRTLDEIARWGNASNAEREAILKRVEERRLRGIAAAPS
ncbi:MAG TPA: DUF1289 domain-containing protein [Burkholderiales bacterium]|nr:DUF1289 domain-containing protein [Burkholderiales bacterium]